MIPTIGLMVAAIGLPVCLYIMARGIELSRAGVYVRWYLGLPCVRGGPRCHHRSVRGLTVLLLVSGVEISELGDLR